MICHRIRLPDFGSIANPHQSLLVAKEMHKSSAFLDALITTWIHIEIPIFLSYLSVNAFDSLKRLLDNSVEIQIYTFSKTSADSKTVLQLSHHVPAWILRVRLGFLWFVHEHFLTSYKPSVNGSAYATETRFELSNWNFTLNWVAKNESMYKWDHCIGRTSGKEI